MKVYKEEKITIPVEICHEKAVLPKYAHKGDAGMDIYACEDTDVPPLKTVLVRTGLKFAIPEGFEIQVRPRSGLSLKTPLRIPNAPGTIDAGFRDEAKVIVWNSSQDETIHINAGDRIAQFVLARVPKACFQVVPDVSAIGENRGGGFGSSGVSAKI